MSTYKKDQGRLARMAAFWAVALLLLFGVVSLHTWMSATFDSLGEPIGGFVVPIVGVKLSPAFLVTGLLFVGGIVLIRSWQSRPQVCDMLIETESELRKVTWPQGEEVVDSSLVVIAFVIFIMAFLASADIALGWFFGRILAPGS